MVTMGVLSYEICLRAMSLLERLCVLFPRFGRFYHRLFYAPVIKEEIALARLQPGERVLHIGGGSYPFTALQLAAYGCEVCLIDNNNKAVAAARQVVARNNLLHRIQVILGDGQEMSGNEFDAVWISLLVQPKRKIVKKLLNSLARQNQLRIVYRNPRGLFKCFYPAVNPHLIAPQYDRRLVLQPAKKESVVIARGGG